jgi:phosphate/sulfate permease
MILQAAGLALLAALSPTALLVGAVYLGSARPRLVGTLYLAGAILMSLVMGIVVIVILRNAGLNLHRQHSARYGLRLGLGVLILAAGAVLAKRKPKVPDPENPKQGLVSRMIANPAPASAFAVGLLLFAPGVTFIAAVQVIATANVSNEESIVALIVVVVINAALVWLPLLLHLFAPGVTTRRLTAFNAWLRANGNKILIWVLLVAGAILVGNGIYGLVVVK